MGPKVVLEYRNGNSGGIIGVMESIWTLGNVLLSIMLEKLSLSQRSR